LVTFFSFCFFGFFPLIPTIVAKANDIVINNNFIWITSLVAILFLFILGFGKSFVTGAKWYFSSLETIIIGALSAGAAYGIGAAFGE
jgi:VIT1/CCC1 family predicted Fe2+/Mn2+ transporter